MLKGVFSIVWHTVLPRSQPFVRVMQQVLLEIDNVKVTLNDMLITGKTEEKHLKTLELVLVRLKYNGLNSAMCKFFQDSVVFCVHNND